MIIEFNGMPGTGKTTVSNRIISKKKSFNKTFIEYKNCLSYFSDKNRVKKNLWFINKLIKPSNIRLFYYTFLFILSTGFVTKDKVCRGIILVKTYMHYKDISNKSNNDFIIVDQGIIQQILSILYLKDLNKTKYITKILNHIKNSVNITIVNTDLNVEENINRIINREENNSRLDLMNIKNVHFAIAMQNKNLGKVRGIIKELNIKQINIDTNLDTEFNAHKVIGRI